MTPELNEALFFIACMDTLIKAHAGQMEASDWAFIDALEDRAEFYGFAPRLGSHIAGRLRDIADHGLPAGMPAPSFDIWFRSMRAGPQRAPKQPYVFNSHVIELRRQGCSIREISNMLGETRANVSRMIREPPQMWFFFSGP